MNPPTKEQLRHMARVASIIAEAFHESAICFSMIPLRETGEERMVMCLGSPLPDPVTGAPPEIGCKVGKLIPIALILSPEQAEDLLIMEHGQEIPDGGMN